MKKLVLILANRKFRVRSKFKMFPLFTVAILGLYFTVSANIFADFYVYPKEDHSPEQLNRDKFECYEWAKQQTGIDPMNLSTPSPQSRQGKSSQRGKVFRGALGGNPYGTISDGVPKGNEVIIGSPTGGTGNNVIMGAPGGGLFHNRRKSQAEQEQIRAQERANHHKKLLIEDFNNAYKDCLMELGYSVY